MRGWTHREREAVRAAYPPSVPEAEVWRRFAAYVEEGLRELAAYVWRDSRIVRPGN